MIEEKARLVQLLDEYIGGRRPDGRHRLRASLAGAAAFSLVASTYSDGRGTGAVGVIGPTRMRYSRAINAVESLSKAISRMVGASSLTRQGRRSRRHGLHSHGRQSHRRNRSGTTADSRRRADDRAPTSADALDELQRSSATSTTICCCARPRSSTTTASGPSASARAWPRRRPPICSRAAAARRRPRARAEGRRRRRRRRGLSPRRRADPPAAARDAAQARRPADRGARRRFRSALPSGGRARAGAGRREGEVIEEFAAATCSAIGCCARRW